MWEYVRLSNENTAREWTLIEKLQKVALIILGATCVMEIIAIVIAVFTALKH